MAFRNQAINWLMPGALWLWLFYHLHNEWTLNPQYGYGWAVPFLALLLWFFRWRSRPAPDSRAENRIGSAWFAFPLALLLPIRLVEEANPDWRLLGWLLGFVVVAFSLLLLARLGGKTWLSHFAFPVCFPLVAVPWPVQLENIVVQNMMGAVAYAAVEVAGWLGVGAYQLGNVIQLRNGLVGVDEACSGVKTLQAGIMVSLVLGEIFRLRTHRRMALIFLGCGWIFICNIFRATALVIVAATHGLEALARWHDFIGTAVLLSGMAGVLALGWIWKTESAPTPVERKSVTIVPGLAWQVAALAWIIFVFAVTEVWYRSHEHRLIELPRWQATWPGEKESFREMPIPDTTRAILHYDDAKSAIWEDPAGVRWWIFFAHWKPQRAALQLVRSHSPEICLPAVGRTFRRQHPVVTLAAGQVPLEFQTYEFEQNGRPLFVFVCIQEDKVALTSKQYSEGWNARGRLLAAWHGKRNLGQRLLEIAVSGLEGFAPAKAAAAKTVGEIVRSTD